MAGFRRAATSANSGSMKNSSALRHAPRSSSTSCRQVDVPRLLEPVVALREAARPLHQRRILGEIRLGRLAHVDARRQAHGGVQHVAIQLVVERHDHVVETHALGLVGEHRPVVVEDRRNPLRGQHQVGRRRRSRTGSRTVPRGRACRAHARGLRQGTGAATPRRRPTGRESASVGICVVMAGLYAVSRASAGVCRRRARRPSRCSR